MTSSVYLLITLLLFSACVPAPSNILDDNLPDDAASASSKTSIPPDKDVDSVENKENGFVNNDPSDPEVQAS